MPECFRCGDVADHSLSGVSELSGLCESCWLARHHNGVEDTLADVGVLTPRLVVELETHLIDTTDAVESTTFTKGMSGLLGDMRTTTLRRGDAEELAVHAGIPSSVDPEFYDMQMWPGAKAGTSLYATALLVPIGETLPLTMAAFVAGHSLDEIDDRIETVIESLDRDEHQEVADDGI